MTALPICAALRQCCERTAVCCTSHRCYPPFLLYTTLTLPCTVLAMYTRGWNVNHLQPFGCSALFMLSTLTLTPVIISSVDIQKV